MRKRSFNAIINAIALVCATTLAPLVALAQEPGGTVSLSTQSGRVSVKLERGSRVAISNRYGRITVTGWDRDTVEASATSSKGAEAIQVDMTADPQARSALTLAVVGRNRGNTPFIYAPSAPMPAARPVPAPNTKPPTAPAAERERVRQETREEIKEAAKNGVILVPIPEIVVETTPNVVVRTPQPATPATPGARGTGSGSGSGSGSGAGRGSGGVVYGVGHGGVVGEDSGITLDVKVPRYAQLDTIEVRAGDLNISNIDGPVSVLSGSSNINVSRVGSLEVRSRGGDINVEDVDGLVYIVASSGDINVRRSNGDVRATSTNGNINVSCAKGRVDASNVRGEITLTNVGGDVEATTTEADINFAGTIANNGRYRLKSMEGKITMSVPESSPGFTATLMSYNSDASTDFTVRSSTAHTDSQSNRRVEARHGDGQAQITLDSFSQPVRLVKLAAGAPPACK